LIAYGVSVFLAFLLFVLYYEEPRLMHEFPESYPSYFDNVPRWRPRFTPWRPE
jgi:protein-S-isoprenylcysteine O-methyltransferase Ste14